MLNISNIYWNGNLVSRKFITAVVVADTVLNIAFGIGLGWILFS